MAGQKNELSMSELLSLTASTVEELADQCVRFHDFPFDLEAQSFDPVERTWTGNFIRGTRDPARVVTTRRSVFVKVTEFPIFATRITIHNVSEAEIQDRAQIGYYSFHQLHRTDYGCRFEFHQDCDIYITVDGAFVATLHDVAELTDMRGRITSVGFLDFGIEIGAA
jgi:hypothetical protein